MHNNVKITKDHQKKLSVHAMYDHTKGGVDFVNLLSTTHSTQIKSRRWSLNGLAFILDTCRSNAKTILEDSGMKLTNFEMTYNLGKELVLPAIRKRYSQSTGLKITVINKITHVLGIDEVSTQPQPENFNLTFGRCFKCVAAFFSKKSYNTEREKLNNKLNVWNAKSLYVKSTKQNCNLPVKIVLSNQTLL